ncbi:hypothetical protein QE152_g29179 [Popillia japonica]|uniref:Uncharacterized protein n=1 Tax=Popillia japonica TaxID=7064 RepID=A0AAW1JJW2_POPJA
MRRIVLERIDEKVATRPKKETTNCAKRNTASLNNKRFGNKLRENLNIDKNSGILRMAWHWRPTSQQKRQRRYRIPSMSASSVSVAAKYKPPHPFVQFRIYQISTIGLVSRFSKS